MTTTTMLWSEIPIELTIRILTFFDPVELVNFRGVNSFFKSLIDETITLQYCIALFASGMVDGPPGSLTASERLELLKSYEASWKNIQWSHWQHHSVSYPEGPAWELYGNVWAHSRGSDAIDFVQIPSSLRGIPMHQWTLRFDYDVADFCMDPSQDLLVIIENTMGNLPNLCRIWLHTLSTGEKHPLAESTVALEHTLELDHTQATEQVFALYSFRVCGDYVGILVRNPGRCKNELVVWNWKTGVHNLMVLSTTVQSFVFLDDNLILGSSCWPAPPALLVYRLEHRPADETTPTTTHSLRFLLGPRFLGPQNSSYILLASDPSPGRLPSTGQVPFHLASDERMIAIYTQFFDDWLNWTRANDSSETFLIPAKALLRQIESLSLEDGLDVGWLVHGLHSSGIEHAPEHRSWDESWPTFVFGMRHVFPEVLTLDGKPNILIRDLSPRRCRRASNEDREASDALYEAIRPPPRPHDGMPHPRSILKCVPLPENVEPSLDMRLLISEDGIVVVENARAAEGPGVLHLLTL